MQIQQKRHKSVRYLCLSLCALLPLCASLPAVAADVVQPPRKVSTILKDIKKVEADTNKLFNALNSSDDYDLVCYAFKQTGSKTRQRVCEPQFMKDARNADAQRFVNGTRQGTDLTVPKSDAILQGGVQDKMAGLRQELQVVTKASPEFAALMQQLQALVKEYAAHDKARNNDPALGFLSRFMQSQYQ